MLKGNELKGEQLCLVCKHLYRLDDSICNCKTRGITPILAPAKLVHRMSIKDIRFLPEYKQHFMHYELAKSRKHNHPYN